MSKMIAAQVVGPKDVRLVEAPPPGLRSFQALIRVTHVGLCGSDWPVYDGQAGKYPQPPGVPAHEVIGLVEDFSAGDLQQGSRVLVVTSSGLAEYVAAPPDALLPVPTHIPPEQMLLCQPLGTVIHALRKLPWPLGARTIIIGAGTIGLLFAAMLSRAGCREVIVIDPLGDRLERARQIGATETVQATAAEALAEGLGGADVVVEAVGVPETIAVAPALARRGGITLMFGVPRNLLPDGRVGFPVRQLLYEEAQIIYSHGPDLNADIGLARDLIAAGRIDVSSIVTHVLPFSQVAEAFAMAYEHRPGVGKIVLTFG
ncbi:MAG: zinc-binding dehydrogenase [Armatimonadetes bacterium]|nr:zinc-binding dehydrogenase [Armatimonadota bacterium]